MARAKYRLKIRHRGKIESEELPAWLLIPFVKGVLTRRGELEVRIKRLRQGESGK